MHPDHPYYPSRPYLTKRNDSYFFINVKQGPSLPPPFHAASPPSHFLPPLPAPPFAHSRPKRHSAGAFRARRGAGPEWTFSGLRDQYRKMTEMESFQRNLEQMEMQIFGRKIEQEMPQRYWPESNEIGNLDLNFAADFDRAHDVSHFMENSVGAEDSPLATSARRMQSGKKSARSGVDSGRSTFCPRNANSRRSTLLNDFEIQNNFSGFSHPLYTQRPSRFKKVKSSMHIRLPEALADSDRHDSDSFPDDLAHSLIRPRVVKRPFNSQCGSGRTVGALESSERKSTFGRSNVERSSGSNLNGRPGLRARIAPGRYPQYLAPQGFGGGDMGHALDSEKNVFFVNDKPSGRNHDRKSQDGRGHERRDDTGAGQRIYKIMKNMSKIIYDRTLRRDQGRLKRDIESCLEGVEVRMNHLIGLKNLLSKFMKEEPVTTEDLQLSNLEILLFCLFLVKKRYLDLEALQWTPEVINQFRDREMLKRSEQNYKVVLKRAFKTLISTFNAENSILGGSENEFYEHYFGDVAREFGLSIDLFKPQQIFNEIKRGGQAKKFEKRKSKKEFASMLKRSASFMSLLQKYLQDRLVINGKKEGIFRDCMKELDRKLPLMIFNWQKRLGNEKNFKEEFVKFLVETLVNDKVKLPWSAAEVRRGISSVLALFRKA